MAERMTDERLAEYEQLIKGWCPSSDEDDVCVELLQALKAEREYARTLEAKLDAVRGLPKILKLCAEALEIASDWYVEDVQIFPPKTWGLPAHNEDAAEGWCSTFALADRARKVAEELEAALQSAEGPGSNQPELDNTKSAGWRKVDQTGNNRGK